MEPFVVGKRVEVLWKGALFAAEVVKCHRTGAYDVVYEKDGTVGTLVTREEHQLRGHGREIRRHRKTEVAPTHSGGAEQDCRETRRHHRGNDNQVFPQAWASKGDRDRQQHGPDDEAPGVPREILWITGDR